MNPEAPLSLETILTRLVVAPADEEAWRALHRQTWPFVFAVVYRRLHGAFALAEEATQDVFVRLVRTCPFDRLRDAAAFRSYIWRVSDNVARTYARRLAGRKATEVSTSDPEAADGAILPPQPPPSSLEAEDLLHHVMGNLSERDRELLHFVLEGRSLPEIAQATELTYGAAAVRLHRLRQRLRKSLFYKESNPI